MESPRVRRVKCSVPALSSCSVGSVPASPSKISFSHPSLRSEDATDASSWLAMSSCSSFEDTTDLGAITVSNTTAIDCGGSRCKIVSFQPPPTPLPSYITIDKGPRVPIVEHNARPSPLQYFTLPTTRLPEWMEFCCKEDGVMQDGDEVNATGGGAYKYKDILQERLGLSLNPLSEMRTVVDGLNLLLALAPADEVFEYDWMAKAKRVVTSNSRTYPYLITSIGSGVSIIKVTGEGEWERVSGSCIGGGTFWGLSKLLTDIQTWDELEAVRQVEGQTGDNRQVDLLVGDIYGKRCMKNLGLGEHVIASSFGKCGVQSNSEEDAGSAAKPEGGSKNIPPLATGSQARRKKYRKKGSKDAPIRDKYHAPDMCRSLLLMVANNIGQITYLNAKIHGVENIYFTGGFTHDNPYVWAKLSYAINFWSKGEMTARFLEHDGYLGALGALVHSEK